MQLASLYRDYSGQIVAYLMSFTQDLDLAQELWHDTVESALAQWQHQVPDNPVAWLYKVARHKAVDRLRHHSMSMEKSRLLQAHVMQLPEEEQDFAIRRFGDQQLCLIFTCCHPALDFDKQVALTLHTICGLGTEQISRALVLPKTTLEQRLTRAKRKIKQAGIPYIVPEPRQLPNRINAVLKTLYLVFNADNDELADIQLAVEAIRLCRHLVTLMPSEVEIQGLLALMLFHHSRRAARNNSEGKTVLLKEQDRNYWDRTMIQEADHLLQSALAKRQVGSYQIQAAIQGVHCMAPDFEQTDWLQIEGLYHVLMQIDSNPVIAVNAAVASGLARGPEVGLVKLAECEKNRQLTNYALLHSAIAEMLERLGRLNDAAERYQQAVNVARDKQEKDFYRSQLARFTRG